MWSAGTKRSSSVFVRIMSAVAFKVQVVLRSLIAFVLMSTVTAMTVRTLLSSGVVIMFPMVMLMERMGLQGVDMHVREVFGFRFFFGVFFRHHEYDVGISYTWREVSVSVREFLRMGAAP